MTIETVKIAPQRNAAERDEVWSLLCRKALPQIRKYFLPTFEDDLRHLGMLDGVMPTFEELRKSFFDATGWEIYEPTPDLKTRKILELFAQKKFPVLSKLRPLSQIDRAEAPDAFHDLLGHLPMFLDPCIASIYEAFGHQARAVDKSSFKYLSLLYTNTLEFGLQQVEGKLRGFGAALASAPEELRYALGSPIPRRVRLDPTCEVDVVRAMRTRYHFDKLQETYFVVTSWGAFRTMLESDMTGYYQSLSGASFYLPGEASGSDVLVAL